MIKKTLLLTYERKPLIDIFVDLTTEVAPGQNFVIHKGRMQMRGLAIADNLIEIKDHFKPEINYYIRDIVYLKLLKKKIWLKETHVHQNMKLYLNKLHNKIYYYNNYSDFTSIDLNRQSYYAHKIIRFQFFLHPHT